MRRRSFRGNALARLLRQALLGSFALDRGQARRFIGSDTIPRCRCRLLFGSGAFLGDGCRPHFGLRAPGGDSLQRLLSIGSCSGNTRGLAIHFSAGISLRLCTLLDYSTRLRCCCGRPLDSNAFPGLRGEIPLLHFALRSCHARRFIGSGSCSFTGIGIPAALHCLHQQAGG